MRARSLSQTLIMVSLHFYAHFLAVLVGLQNLIVDTLLQILENLCEAFHQFRLDRSLVATGTRQRLLRRQL